ncbi:hypothetical protein F5Y06DRAFT_211243 [Hypoxylon sp. FL0890]|nr:hypothetical protein F5Y06DRAFT_211243 [Hypoxylon sp. FL0890]
MDPAVEQAIEQDVTNFLNAQSGDMPQNYPWDFRPMIRSIAERNFKIAGFFNMPPRPAAAPAADSFWVNHVIGDDRPDGPPTFQPESIYRKPGGGSWDWVWYIPEWSHPDFHPDIARTYSGSIKYIGHSDPLSLMRPALRTADRVRAPTEWAKRFGIHPDELGGRSRLSPTLSSTRDPFEDFANQVNRLSEEETKQAIQLTKEAANRAGVKLPDDPNYIDPMVMEEMLSQHGLMSGAELKESLKEVMGKTDNIQNLDALVEVLNERNPEIYKAHQTFLHNALRDQDYQRLVFHEMTTDELVSGNVLTMSNDAKCDLQGEIHP